MRWYSNPSLNKTSLNTLNKNDGHGEVSVSRALRKILSGLNILYSSMNIILHYLLMKILQKAGEKNKRVLSPLRKFDTPCRVRIQVNAAVSFSSCSPPSTKMPFLRSAIDVS